jgi:hypothetical protein
MSDGDTTFDVRVYRTEVYKGVRVTTYRVRWKVGSQQWREGFRTAAQADSFRSALMTATRKGEAFEPGHRQADGMGTRQVRHQLVRVRLRLRGHEVEAGFGQVPQGHRPGADRGHTGDAGRGTRTAR